MKLLGVDAGGTATKLRLWEDGEETDLAQQGPMNAIMDEGLAERCAQLILDNDADGAVFGIAGLRQPSLLASLRDQVKALTGVQVQFADDALIALWGAHSDQPGGIVIAGTGSVALGRGATDGEVTRIGGHGFLLGDEGSGYWIGKELTSAALRSYTGAGPKLERVEDIVFWHLGLNPDVVERVVYGNPTDRSAIAAVAASASTATNDPFVNSVFVAAADHLIGLGHSLKKLVGDIPLSMVGGVWNVSVIQERFVAEFGSTAPTASPASGAIKWALHNARSYGHSQRNSI